MEYKITDSVTDIITIMVTQLDSFVCLPIMVEKSTILRSIKVHMTSNANRQIVIGKLTESVKKSTYALVEFLKILALGLVAALLLVLPWLLRIASLLAWLIGGYLAVMAIQSTYSAFSNSGEVLALQFAAITALVAIALMVMLGGGEKLWGGLVLGGVLFGLAAVGAKKLYAIPGGEMVLQVLPPALLATSMIVMAIRLRTMRRSERRIKFSAPLFKWIQKPTKKEKTWNKFTP